MSISHYKFTTETQGEIDMKTITKTIMGLIFFNSILLCMAGPPPPPPPLFKAKNATPVYQPPLNLAGENQSAFFLQMSSTVSSEINGKIELEGTNTMSDGLRDGKNFKWEVPSANVKIGVCPALSKYTSLNFILGLDNAKGRTRVTGFNLGFNAIVSRNENHNVRLGLGINFTEKNFVWVQSATGEETLDNDFDYDPFLYLTYNTNFNDWFINPFIQCSYSRQTLLDNEDYSREVSFAVNAYTITPGLSYNWNKDKLISLGFTFTYVTGIENTKKLAFTPLLQFSYLFGKGE
jgi:hypothetical protein